MPSKRRVFVAGAGIAGIVVLSVGMIGWHYISDTEAKCANLPPHLERAVAAKVEADAAARRAETDKSELTQAAARKALERFNEAVEAAKKAAAQSKSVANKGSGATWLACRG